VARCKSLLNVVKFYNELSNIVYLKHVKYRINTREQVFYFFSLEIGYNNFLFNT